MAFLSIANLALAQAIGADIANRTFVDRPDLPFAWFDELRKMGFNPVPPAAPPPAAVADDISEMPFERYCQLRAADWVPGQAIPPEATD